MDIFGTAPAAIGVLDHSRQLVNTIYQQHQRMKKVPEKCDELSAGLDKMKEVLCEFKLYKSESMTPMNIKQVTKISEYLGHVEGVLEVKGTKASSSKMGLLLRARKASETLNELIDKFKDLELRGLVIDVRESNQTGILQGSSEGREEKSTA